MTDIKSTLTSITGIGANPAAQAKAQDHLVLEVNHVSGGYHTPGLFGRGKYATVRSWVLSEKAAPENPPSPE